MSSVGWKVLSMVGIKRSVDEDLPETPVADASALRTPEKSQARSTPQSLSRKNLHVSFSPNPVEHIPQYDLVNEAKPRGETPIRLMRECAARSSPGTAKDLVPTIDQLEGVIDDLNQQVDALTKENMRVIRENKLLRERLAEHNINVSDAGSK